jgi:quinol-cytochrome oxidoreductase complex cytochrome b subunit
MDPETISGCRRTGVMDRFDEQPTVDLDSWKWIAALTILMAVFVGGVFLAGRLGQLTGSFYLTLLAGALIVFASELIAKIDFFAKFLGRGRYKQEDVDEQRWWVRALGWIIIVSMPFMTWFFYSTAQSEFESQGASTRVVFSGFWIGVLAKSAFYEIRAALVRRKKMQS